MGKNSILSHRRIVLRLLPPSMVLDECIDFVQNYGFTINKDYKLLYYVQGSLLSLPYSRCYLEVVSRDLVDGFLKKLDRTTINGWPNKVSASLAPYPYICTNEITFNNTIDTDPDFIQFLENEENEYVQDSNSEEKIYKPIVFEETDDLKKQTLAVRNSILKFIDKDKAKGKQKAEQSKRNGKRRNKGNKKEKPQKPKKTVEMPKIIKPAM